MTNQEIHDYLARTPKRYDRESYDLFLHEVGVPNLKNAIHITGTNGKGSSARYLADTLQNCGYKVGLYTSPHFEVVNELASINGVQISNDYISKLIEEYDFYFKKHALSLFEIMTFISFSYFIFEAVDYAIIEVGMGGTTDATNIFNPILSVITNIGFDHVKELGPSLEDIARNKAGIIKEKVPVIIGKMPEVAETIIKEVARSKHATCYSLNYDYEIINKDIEMIEFNYEDKTFRINSGAKYEVINAILVFNILKILDPVIPNITLSAFKKALLKRPFKGRFTVVSKKPLIIVDGAHNVHALTSVINDVKTYQKQVKVIFAAFKDKDYVQELNMLQLANAEVTLTSFEHPRALKEFTDFKHPFFANYRDAIEHTMQTLSNNDLLLIVGSLYFAEIVVREFEGGCYVHYQKTSN